MSLPKYYWDSSIFCMVLGEEKCHGPGVLDSAKEILYKMETGRAVIVTSQITVVEVLPSKYPVQVYDKFTAWLQRANLHIRGVDHPVAMKAVEIRDLCIQKKVRIETPDALHVATAWVYRNEIEELHSVDSDFEKALKNSKVGLTCRKPFIPPPPPAPIVIQSAGPTLQMALPTLEEGDEEDDDDGT